MAAIDYVVIIIYLILVVALGLWTGRKVKNASDYFLPRKFGKGFMTMHAFGSGTASDQSVAVAASSFSKGLSGIWYMWLWLFVTPFYWLMAPLFSRLRVTTTAQVYEMRFGKAVGLLYACMGILILVTKMALMFKGGGAIIEAVSHGQVSSEMAVLGLAVLMLIYSHSGGLSAAILTDFIQGILSLVFSFILLPAVLQSVGYMTGIRATIDDPSFLSLTVPGDINIFYIMMFSILGLVGIVAQPHTMSGCASGKSETDGRIGYVAGNLIKRVCTAAWCLTGVAALAWFIQTEQVISPDSADQVYGLLASEFLAPGLLGLFAASMLASIMSSCDTFMVSASALFCENILPQSKSLREQKIRWAKWIGMTLILLSICLAFLMSDVVTALKFWLKLGPIIGISFWLGFFFKKFNHWGVWTSTITGFSAWYLAPKWIDTESWQILFYLSAASIAGLVVSYLFGSSLESQVEEIHSRSLWRNNGNAESVQKPTSETPEKIWVNNDHLFIPRLSKTSTLGFAIIALIAVAMIVAFVGITSI